MEGCEEVNKDKKQGKKKGKWTHEEEEKEYTDTSRKSERWKAERCSGSSEVHRDLEQV